jgi:hypothetical protein
VFGNGIPEILHQILGYELNNKERGIQLQQGWRIFFFSKYRNHLVASGLPVSSVNDGAPRGVREVQTGNLWRSVGIQHECVRSTKRIPERGPGRR